MRVFYWLSALTGLVIVFGIVVISQNTSNEPLELMPASVVVEKENIVNDVVVDEEIKTEDDVVAKEEFDTVTPIAATLPEKIIHLVPFTSQAPFGDWSDQRFQDGCEEASMIMVRHWLQDTTPTPHTATQDILALAAWELEQYGTYRDTSAEDTQLTLDKYFKISSVLTDKVSEFNIKQALASGAVVLVPSNGAVLDNPFYSAPPEHHMIVIVGYDDTTKEFITNDPGTRRGEGYRYAYSTVLAAAQDYPTGDHIETSTRNPAMLVIRP